MAATCIIHLSFPYTFFVLQRAIKSVRHLRLQMCQFWTASYRISHRDKEYELSCRVLEVIMTIKGVILPTQSN
jgi:hypothetical protein